MATIQEARQQIEQAKREIAIREAQGEEARKKLEQTRQSLPDVRSQRALRQQLSGLQGRDFRQKVAGAEREISGKELEVEQFVKSLEPYKQQVASAEAQVSDIEDRQRAIENIQKVAGRSNGEFILSMIASKGSGYERKYAREYLKNIQSQRDFNEDLTNALESYNQGNADALNKFGGIEKLEKLKLIKVNEVKLDVPKIDDRTTQVQVQTKLDTSPVKKGGWLTGFSILPMASAQEYTPPKVQDLRGEVIKAPTKTITSTIKGLFNIPVAGTGTRTLSDIYTEVVKPDISGVGEIISPKIKFIPQGQFMPNVPRVETYYGQDLSMNKITFDPDKVLETPKKIVSSVGELTKRGYETGRRTVSDTFSYFKPKAIPYFALTSKIVQQDIKDTKESGKKVISLISDVSQDVSRTKEYISKKAIPYFALGYSVGEQEVKKSVKSVKDITQPVFSLFKETKKTTDSLFIKSTQFISLGSRIAKEEIEPATRVIRPTTDFISGKVSDIEKSTLGLSLLGIKKAQPYINILTTDRPKQEGVTFGEVITKTASDLWFGQDKGNIEYLEREKLIKGMSDLSELSEEDIKKLRSEGVEVKEVNGKLDLINPKPIFEFGFAGNTLPVTISSSRVYRLFGGIKESVKTFGEDIFIRADRSALIKPQVEFRPYGFFESETGMKYVKPISEEQRLKYARQFGSGLGMAWETGTYFTPIAPVKIGLGLAETTIRGKGIEFVKENPFDVAYLGTMGVVGAYKGIKYLREPITSSLKKVSPTITSVTTIGDKTKVGQLSLRPFKTVRTISYSEQYGFQAPRYRFLIDKVTGKGVVGDVVKLSNAKTFKNVVIGYASDKSAVGLSILNKGGKTSWVDLVVGRVGKEGRKIKELTGAEMKLLSKVSKESKLPFVTDRLFEKITFGKGASIGRFKISPSGITQLKTPSTFSIVGIKSQPVRTRLASNILTREIPYQTTKDVSLFYQSSTQTGRGGRLFGEKGLTFQIPKTTRVVSDVGTSTKEIKQVKDIATNVVSKEQKNILNIISNQEKVSISSIVPEIKPSNIKIPTPITQDISKSKSIITGSIISPTKDLTIEKTLVASETQSIKSNLQISSDVSQRQEAKSEQVLKIGEKSKTILKSLSRQTNIQTSQNLLKTIPQQGFRQIQKSEQVLKLKTKQAQLLRPKQATKKVNTRPQQPKPPIVIPPTKLSSVVSKIGKMAREEPEEFEIFVAKAGKDISIGKKGTQKEAEELLIKKLRGTLSASGFLTKGGKKLRVSELKGFGTGEFRPSKVSPFKVVEKKERRLRKSGTGKEIQPFRPRGKRKRSVF